MQLSQKARKALAAGLAISTLVWAGVGIIPTTASAAVHTEGCLVLSGGVVWMITNGTRRGFTSAEVFQSWGYNFSQVVTATAEDVALPVGPIMTYADGTLVKGPSDPLVYLVAGGQKRPFVSGEVFLGLGYSFANVQQAPSNTFADLPTGANMDSTTMAHPDGTKVISNGAIWEMTANGRMGFPSAANFLSYGYKFQHVVAANAADLALPDQGVVPARPACSTVGEPTPTGNVNVSLSGPSSTTLITDQSQATLANFVFSGTGTVTSVSLKRIGVSADTSLSNVYLFDGGTRITDAASVTSGSMINFTNSSGLFSVNGSKTISVRADMNATAGETIGVQLTGATLSSGSVGGLPVTGNTHTVAAAALADVNLATATGSGNTDPGEDIVVWQGNASVTTRDVTLTRLALRQIGSITNSDIRNFDFYVDGTLVASSSSLDANGYVTFNVNKTLTTGTRVLKVVADVVGGSGRTVEMDLRGAYDITVVDTQYNASPVVTATGGFPFGPSSFEINDGTVTVSKATDSPSANVTVGASDVVLGKWTVTAYGEAVKLETLTFGVDTTGGTTSEHTLRNGRVMINGSQYGSTANIAAEDAFASGQAYTVNYTVAAGTSVTVELRADMYDSEGTNNIAAGTVTAVQASMLAGSSNAVPQTSLGTINVPASAVNANTLTVASGSMSLTELASYPDQTVVVPNSSVKLGAWTLNGNSTEAINVNSFEVDFTGADGFDASDDLTNVYVKYGSSTSSIKGTVADSDNTWSQTFTLNANDSLAVELWGSVASTATDGDGDADTMTAFLTVAGITAQSGNTVYADATPGNGSTKDAGVSGQTLTTGTGSISAAVDASSPVSMITEDAKTMTAAAFKFTAATDSFTITEINVNLAGATTVANVTLGGQTKAGATDVTFSGLNINVPANSSVVVPVELQLATVGTGAGSSRENVAVTLDTYKHQNSNGTVTTVTNTDGGAGDLAGNAIYVFAATPTVTEVAIANVDPVGTVDVAKWTVSANGGSIAVKQFGVSVVITENGADATLTAGSFKLFRDGSDITDQVTILNASGASIESGTSLAEGTTAAYIVFSSEETISTSRTYTLRTTLAGAWATGDSIRVDFNSDSASALRYLRDTDADASAVVVGLSDSAGDNEVGPFNLVWSDLSAIPHSATLPDDADDGADAATSSADWTNGYLVKNLPLTPFTLVY